jgi:hypothetical protein
MIIRTKALINNPRGSGAGLFRRFLVVEVAANARGMARAFMATASCKDYDAVNPLLGNRDSDVLLLQTLECQPSVYTPLEQDVTHKTDNDC